MQDKDFLVNLDLFVLERWSQLKNQLEKTEFTQFLHLEINKRMIERLDFLVYKPRNWIHWAPSLTEVESHKALKHFLSGAKCQILYEDTQDMVRATEPFKPKWWQYWQKSELVMTSSKVNQTEMIWSNLQLHEQSHPISLLRNWLELLSSNGFIMFSCFGPDTLVELRNIYHTLGWGAMGGTFIDMHDWGDCLIKLGYVEPVLSMEYLTLSYNKVEDLLADLRQLGRNTHIHRDSKVHGKRWLHNYKKLLEEQWPHKDDQGHLLLTVEIIYGHGWKIDRKPRDEQVILLDQSIKLRTPP
ncbi:MAG: hypothetical protein QM520_01515 [Gammaproteobacteria bacterium]|nr:hypothetical protein [Gammaproteobacteria bacterium]